MSIATEITRLMGAKADIKASLNNKKANLIADETIDDYSSLIDGATSLVDTNAANAIAGDIKKIKLPL